MMKEIEEIKTKIEGETVKVFVRFSPRKGADSRRRFYVHDALEYAKQIHPKLDIGKAIKSCTAKNYGDSLEGEWVFELKKKSVAKKRSSRKSLKDVKAEAENKEVVSE
jgi:hypothetical protein